MLYRSGAGAWSLVKDEVVAFGIRWHKPGRVDRAVRFMVTTGRPEFAPQIWLLLSADHAGSNMNSKLQILELRYHSSCPGSPPVAVIK
jgi:hypothetical protein